MKAGIQDLRNPIIAVIQESTWSARLRQEHRRTIGGTAVNRHDRYTYRVTWSDEDEKLVGLCAEFGLRSHLDDTPGKAFSGIREVVEVAVKASDEAGAPITEPLPPRRYRGRYIVERFISRNERCRRTFTCYDRLACRYIAFSHLASTLISLRGNVNGPRNWRIVVRGYAGGVGRSIRLAGLWVCDTVLVMSGAAVEADRVLGSWVFGMISPVASSWTLRPESRLLRTGRTQDARQWCLRLEQR